MDKRKNGCRGGICCPVGPSYSSTQSSHKVKWVRFEDKCKQILHKSKSTLPSNYHLSEDSRGD